jgi:hypothetical protein
MLRAATVSALTILVVLTMTPDLQAQGKSGKGKTAEVKAQVVAGFSISERQIIVEFFREHHYEAQALPPGIAKNLARGKPLPPGIAKKQIPAKLHARLPSRSGVEITIFGDRIVLLEASGLVVDVLTGIFN